MALFSMATVCIMSLFAVIGIIDKIVFKNRFGLGNEFVTGLKMIGSLTLSIAGIICLSPAIATVIENTISPVYKKLGLDPSMAVTTILAIDMGGYQLAQSVALSPIIGKWAGIVFGSMMGATIVFSIPVGLSFVRKQDITAFSKGILYGLASIPVGTFIGALMMGISAVAAFKNLIIPICFSVLIILCLKYFPHGTSEVFKVFSKTVDILALSGLALAIIKEQILKYFFDVTTIPFFRLLTPINDGIAIAGTIAIFLSGALPFVFCLKKWLKKPLERISLKTGLSDYAVTGFLLSCANNMVMFATMEKMSEKEKTLNVAFAVGASFIIGDHLAFVAANAPECIAPMMVAKAVSGILAIVIAASNI